MVLSLAKEAPEREQGTVVLERNTHPRDKTSAGALGDRVPRRSWLAWDLSVRRATVRPASGPPRLRFASLLANTTALLAAGCYHWAGRLPPLRTRLPALGSVAARAARGALHA